jgi:iron complex outermembrane receptor protein
VGTNYRFSNALSVFANYNVGYQAPDIDRLFNFGGGFNGFITPAKSKTFNIGLNHIAQSNRLKVTAFHADVDHEIYLNPVTFANTNIDESHKYGLEIQDTWKISDKLATTVLYTYTRAIIDKDVDGGGLYDGKNLPGVPKHSVVANLNYQFIEHANLNLNQAWRSEAYAYNDFQNNFSQRQDKYLSTNIALNYQYKNINFFTAINNLFEHENSIQVADNSIYPVDFVRTWRIGMKADF